MSHGVFPTAVTTEMIRRSRVGAGLPLPAGRVARGAAASPTVPFTHVCLVALTLFLLAGANGRPIWWSSAFPAAMICLWLVGSRGPERLMEHALSRTNAPIFWSLVSLTACGALSTAAAMDIDTTLVFVLRCVVPLLIYMSVVGMRLRPSDVGVCVVALMLGSSIPLVSGLVAFYRAGGTTDLGDLLYARYDLNRMAGYMDATFGNVSHVGGYALLVTPTILVAMYSDFVGRARALARWASGAAFGLWLCIIVFNVIVSGSRTACAVGLAISAGLTLALQKSRLVLVLAAALIGCSAFLLSGDLVDESMLIERVMPAMGSTGRDNSVEERLESIEIGWETFKAHAAVGVGVGMSPQHNPFGVPHQSVVMVASETGLFGGLSFLCLNLLVMFRAARHAWNARKHAIDRERLLWIAGPAAWMAGGLLAGITFNMNAALLWVGIAYAMLGLYGFDAPRSPMRVAPENTTRVGGMTT